MIWLDALISYLICAAAVLLTRWAEIRFHFDFIEVTDDGFERTDEY